ncbi:hypothetical protein KCU93_g5675, partial [Aureobasidium melanogenum]
MARAVRAACLEHRYLTFAPQSSQSHEEPRTTAEQLRQQAEQSEEHAEEPQSTVDEPHGRAQKSPEHVQQSPEHAEEPQATVEEPRQQAEQSPEHAEEPQATAEQSQEHAEEPQTTAEDAPEQDEPDQQSSKHTDEDDEQTPEQNEELDQQSPEYTDEDDDETPSLDFMHGKKRRRQIPSSDSDSSEFETTSGAPAATTSRNSTVNQSTIAPIIMFGSAAPTTLIVSNKAINRRTANDYAGTTSGMVYSCPVNGGEQSIDEAWKGFLNDFALQHHIQQSLCEESNALLAGLEACKQCNNGSSLLYTIGALIHSEDDHENLMTRAGSRYVCDPCDIGFLNKELLWGHLALVSQRRDGYPVVTKELNMWYSAPDIVPS